MTDEKTKFLEEKANDIRKSVIEMLVEAGSGHSAGPLGMADIFTALYFEILNHDPKNPEKEDRDLLVLSNGHICPVQYATMAHVGYFPIEELKTLRKFGTRLQGHPHREKLPGIETSSGPLGSGLSQAVGMSIAMRMDQKENEGSNPDNQRWIYCMLGDGELDCGQIWEAVMLAGKEKLYNIIGIIDRNNIQIDGFTEDIMPLEPLKEKFESFGWHVLEMDGHNMEAIEDTINEAKAVFNKPTMIIARTIPGKGVDFMEREFSWHGKPPSPEEAEKALRQLRSLDGKIKSEDQ
ncbi:MAG: transketolase [Candidatus Marinimicrobia bacterium]|nr:transketolase [Candidatus Neomarinimicrobiota bacterium]